MLYRWTLYLLAPLTFVRVLLTLTWGLLAVLLLFRFLPQPARDWVIRGWSRTLLRVMGVRLISVGPMPPRRSGAGRMLLANHVSWLDVHALNATVPARLVAKSEIARWPVLGLLARNAGTLFVERGRRHAVHAVNHLIAQHLRGGHTIGVYPEGTTTHGRTLLPFHANLIQPALDVQAQLHPVALRYTQWGEYSEAAAYTGGIHLLHSLWRIVTAPALAVEVRWLPPLPAQGKTRHEVAHQARSAIADALQISLEADAQSSPPAPPRAAAN